LFGPELIETLKMVGSTVQLTTPGELTLPAVSVAVTEYVCGPSGRLARPTGLAGQTSYNAVSSLHLNVTLASRSLYVIVAVLNAVIPEIPETTGIGGAVRSTVQLALPEALTLPAASVCVTE
jgi:hypothetical protein